jgi:hypothetical protein
VKLALALALTILWPSVASAEDAVPLGPFKEGDVISFEQLDKLESYLPPPLWEQRRYFFFERMALEIGPPFRQYGVADSYRRATEKFKGQARLGADGSLENYTAGYPFDTDIDCKADPDAGQRILWNLVKRWEGDGHQSTWSFTGWHRGKEQVALRRRGTAKLVFLKERTEPEYADQHGDIFPDERLVYVSVAEVVQPHDRRSTLTRYHYASADGPLDRAQGDDLWVFVPSERKPRRVISVQDIDANFGKGHTLGEAGSLLLDVVPQQYDRTCLGEVAVLAPMNSKSLAYPYGEKYDFGPSGFSFASDRWELRHAYIVRLTPRSADHSYHHRDLYIDKETFEPLYSFAYDRKQELARVVWYNHRYSEDWNGGDPMAADGVWYRGWPGVEKPNDVRAVAEITVDVQTGTGVRLEFWDNHGTPLGDKSKVRRFIDGLHAFR